MIVADFADAPSFTRISQLFNSLYIPGRRVAISVVTNAQVYRTLLPVIQTNTECAVFRLRSRRELDAILEEVERVLEKRTLLEMYNVATQEA